eukprot:383207-Rhodomonas_salina.2
MPLSPCSHIHFSLSPRSDMLASDQAPPESSVSFQPLTSICNAQTDASERLSEVLAWMGQVTELEKELARNGALAKLNLNIDFRAFACVLCILWRVLFASGHRTQTHTHAHAH